MSKLFGIDTSRWQGDFDFKSARDNEGVDFAIIKAGGADDGLYEDREFENSYNKLESAGIHKGAYFFGNALSTDEAVNEARYFAQLLAGKSFCYPVFYDVEAGMVTGNDLTDIIMAFLDEMRNAGYKNVGLYSYENCINNYVDISRVKEAGYAVWVAKYSSNNPSLLLIIIVIGGILAGVFTATEGSAIAVVYATVLSLIYKSFKLKDIPRIVLESAKTTGIITFMIGLSSIMSWAMAFTEIPDMIATAILGLTDNKILILLLINVLLLVVGTFMDVTPAILIFTPILLPICTAFGMSPIQFGILLCFNLSIGTITPPVGTILFTGCRVGGVTIESVIKYMLPYFAIIFVALLLVTYIPAISMFLPKILGLV